MNDFNDVFFILLVIVTEAVAVVDVLFIVVVLHVVMKVPFL